MHEPHFKVHTALAAGPHSAAPRQHLTGGTGSGSAMRERLERSYRLLLLAYPRRYRRHRGVEMLTTLMDLAPPDRKRPPLADALGLLFRGLRCRLSLDGARRSVALTLTVFCATLGAVGGAVLGWQSAQPLPDNATAAEMARVAVPEIPATPHSRWDFLFGYDVDIPPGDKAFVALLGWDEYTPGYVRFTGEVKWDYQAAHDRLTAAGWQIDRVHGNTFILAHRGGSSLELWGPVGEGREISVSIQRATPAGVRLLAAAGLVLGALAGWWLSGWAGRRTRRHGTAHKLTAATVFGLGAGALVLPTLMNLIGIGALYWYPQSEPVAAWMGFVFFLVRGLALLGTALLLTSAVIIALPARRRLVVAAT